MVGHNYEKDNGRRKAEDEDSGGRSVVYGHKLSSVGPGRVTGDLVYEPNNIDLAMKAHYLRVVYWVEKEAAEGITIAKMKESAFAWLNWYYESCGRFRRWETSGRPYIKCNDCGVRFVEAKSPNTLDHWVSQPHASAHRLLVYDNLLGPDLPFSPPVFLQITSFKCGGISLGLSWAHVLGDAFSASYFMNYLAQFLEGKELEYPPNYNKSPPTIPKPINPSSKDPSCLKKVGPLGDHWAVDTHCEMGTFSFHVTPTHLDELQMKLSASDQTPSPVATQTFETLCAVIWQAIAKVKVGPQPDTVTVIKHDPTGPKEKDMLLRNSQIVSSVKAHFSVGEAHLKEIVELICEEAQDERAKIGEMVGRDPGGSDFILYGSNLTFVDLGESAFYGFVLKGLRPKLVNCFVDSIGEEGVVLVLPGPKNGGDTKKEVDVDVDRNVKDGAEGRLVTLILPKAYMEGVKQSLKKEWAFIV